jgi:hypothetical protein
MNVIELSKTPGRILERQSAELAKRLIKVTPVASSSMSFITSMRLASALKKIDTAVVACHTLGDVTAAVSARQISKKERARYGIIYFVSHDQSVPLRIPLELTREIDVWMFPDEKMAKRYAAIEDIIVKDKGFYTEPIAIPETATSSDAETSPLTISWVGEIADTERLDKIMRGAANVSCDLHIIVAGTGKAARVMPIVRRTSAFENSVKVTWLGDEYDLKKIIGQSHLTVKTSDTITSELLALAGSGVGIIDPEKYDNLSDEAYTKDIELLDKCRSMVTRKGEDAKALYHNYIDQCFHVEQLARDIFKAANR